MKTTLMNWLIDYWPVLAPVLYELVVRIVPTKINVSFIDLAFKIIGLIIPNRSVNVTSIIKQSQDEKAVNTTNHVVKIIALLMLVSVSSMAQLNSTFKAARSYNSDSLTVKTEVVGLGSMYGTTNIGAMYYNPISKKWRIYTNGVWKDLLSASGGGTSYLAGNGLTLTGSTFSLGTSATMLQNVVLNGSYNWHQYGLNDWKIYTDNGVTRTGIEVDNISTRMYGHDLTGTNTADFSISNNTIESKVDDGVGNNIDMQISPQDMFIAGNFGGSSINIDYQGGSMTNDFHSGANVSRVYHDNLGLHLTYNLAGNMDFTSTGIDFNSVPDLTWTASTPPSTNSLTTKGYVLGTKTYTGKQNMIASGAVPGLNVGSVAGDPATRVNGDLWYNSTLNTLRTQNNGTVVTLPGTGITNTAANNEFPQSNGTNLIPSGLFYISLGNYALGSASIAGDRLIKSISSTANSQTSIQSQGTSNAQLLSGDGLSSVGVNNNVTSVRGAAINSVNRQGIGALLGLNLWEFTNSNDGSNEIQAGVSTTEIGFTGNGLKPFVFQGVGNASTAIAGTSVIIRGGNAPTINTSLNGGDVTIKGGTIGGGTGKHGNVFILELPTAVTGLPTGALWNNAGILSIAP